MYNNTVSVRRHEMRRAVLAAALALGLILFSAACSGSSDGGLVSEVKASEPPVTTPAVVVADPVVKPVSPAVTFTEAETAFNEKRYGEATEMFAVIAARKPDNAWGHYMHGLSAWKSGDLTRAETAFKLALDRDTNHLKSHLNIARVLIEGGKTGDALVHVEKALTIDSLSVDGYRLLGRVRGDMREYDLSVEAYKKAITLNEKDSWSMNNMGYVLIKSDRFEEALGPLARACELSPKTAVFHNNLGMALERTHRYVQAAESYRRAVEADSSYAKAKASLTRIESVRESVGTTPVDLKVLAETFAASIKSWQ